MPADFTVPGGTRPKSVQTNSLTPPLDCVQTVNAGAFSVDDHVRYVDMTPSPTTFNIASCTTTNGSAVVTKANAFANVRVGDGVSGTGIAGGAKVLSKQNDGQITLSANATATGTPTLTFTPVVFDANLFVERKDFSMAGSFLVMRVRIWAATGLEGFDAAGDAVDDYGAAAYIAAGVEPLLDQRVQLNIDSFLGNMRVARGA